MKYLVIFISVSAILFSCSSAKTEQTNSAISDTTSSKYSISEQPAKTIIDFLKWYRDTPDVEGHLVNNASRETYDSTKYYSVNFDETEKYLGRLKSTGFISEKYVEKWRTYFKKCEKDFKAHPSNDGPPEGFDYDFIMLSQEYDEDFKNIEKVKIISQSVSNNHSTIKLDFLTGNKLTYTLTNIDGKWAIDDIERE